MDAELGFDCVRLCHNFFGHADGVCMSFRLNDIWQMTEGDRADWREIVIKCFTGSDDTRVAV